MTEQDKVNKLIEFYETYKFNDEYLCSIIDLRATDIRKKTREECGELAFDLSNYALYLQKIMNKHSSVYNWVDTNLNHYALNLAKNYTGYIEERKAAAIHENEFAQQMFKLRSKTKKVVDELSYLSDKLRFLSQTVMSVQGLKKQY